jgi:hypothetical protein
MEKCFELITKADVDLPLLPYESKPANVSHDG